MRGQYINFMNTKKYTSVNGTLTRMRCEVMNEQYSTYNVQVYVGTVNRGGEFHNYTNVVVQVLYYVYGGYTRGCQVNMSTSKHHNNPGTHKTPSAHR